MRFENLVLRSLLFGFRCIYYFDVTGFSTIFPYTFINIRTIIIIDAQYKTERSRILNRKCQLPYNIKTSKCVLLLLLLKLCSFQIVYIIVLAY